MHPSEVSKYGIYYWGLKERPHVHAGRKRGITQRWQNEG